MRKRSRKWLFGAAAAVPCAAIASAANAVTISIDWGAAQNGGSPVMTAAETAGVVSAANWNSFTGFSQAAPQFLKNDSGAATSAAVIWSAPGDWTIYGAHPEFTNDAHMMNGYLDHVNENATLQISVAGIPFANYDVYVYHASQGGDGRPGTYTVGATSFFTKDIAGDFTGTYTLDQHLTAAERDLSAGGNYLRFQNVTGDFFTLTAFGEGNNTPRAPVQGIQIVEVLAPEPTSLALFGLVAAAGLARRRRPN